MYKRQIETRPEERIHDGVGAQEVGAKRRRVFADFLDRHADPDEGVVVRTRIARELGKRSRPMNVDGVASRHEVAGDDLSLIHI